MKICQSCHHRFASSQWLCPKCGWSLNAEDGYYPLREDTTDEFEGYRDDFFAPLAEIESGNFWFEGRNRLIIRFLHQYAPDMTSFLEIGCGTGFVLSAIYRAFPQTQVYGAEYFAQGLSFAQQRVPDAIFHQLDARSMPFDSEFDAIGMFDVIEHIKEDELTLSEVVQALKAGGILILTVPQHPFLWSVADEYKHHERRYSRDELISKVETAGLQVLYTTSFVSLLLPLMLFSRLKQNRAKERPDRMTEFQTNPTLNWLLNQVMRFEAAMIQGGIRLRLGGSRLLIARKHDGAY